MSKKTLMIVDDSAMLRDRIAVLVSVHSVLNLDIIGFASDGYEAINWATQRQPQFVTMDLTMPNMDGTQCIERLRDLLPNAKILVISALSDRATALKILRKGAHGFLLKPFSNEELFETLRALTE